MLGDAMDCGESCWSPARRPAMNIKESNKKTRTGRGVEGRPGRRFELRDEAWERIGSLLPTQGRRTITGPRAPACSGSSTAALSGATCLRGTANGSVSATGIDAGHAKRGVRSNPAASAWPTRSGRPHRPERVRHRWVEHPDDPIGPRRDSTSARTVVGMWSSGASAVMLPSRRRAIREAGDALPGHGQARHDPAMPAAPRSI